MAGREGHRRPSTWPRSSPTTGKCTARETSRGLSCLGYALGEGGQDRAVGGLISRPHPALGYPDSAWARPCLSSYSWGLKARRKHPHKQVRASLAVQWLRMPMQGTQVCSLVWEDFTCRGAGRPRAATTEPVLQSPSAATSDVCTALSRRSATGEASATRGPSACLPEQSHGGPGRPWEHKRTQLRRKLRRSCRTRRATAPGVTP